MTEADWLASTDPDAMLDFLRATDRATVRKLQLFGVACCRRIWELFTDERCRKAVEVVERFVDGQATASEMTAAWRGVNTARDLAYGPESTAPREHRSRIGRTTSWAAYALVNIPPADELRRNVVWEDVRDVAENARDIPGRVRVIKAAQADLLRDLFGPLPFREVRIDPRWRTWNDGAVVKLARVTYDVRARPDGLLDRTRMAILADALEEAGCTDAVILEHCRGSGSHVRGCFVLDLILDRNREPV